MSELRIEPHQTTTWDESEAMREQKHINLHNRLSALESSISELDGFVSMLRGDETGPCAGGALTGASQPTFSQVFDQAPDRIQIAQKRIDELRHQLHDLLL